MYWYIWIGGSWPGDIYILENYIPKCIYIWAFLGRELVHEFHQIFKWFCCQKKDSRFESKICCGLVFKLLSTLDKAHNLSGKKRGYLCTVYMGIVKKEISLWQIEVIGQKNVKGWFTTHLNHINYCYCILWLVVSCGIWVTNRYRLNTLVW